MQRDLRHFSLPRDPQAKRKSGIIATLERGRKESMIISVLLIVSVVVFVWAFGPWQGRHADEPTRTETRIAIRAAESFGFTSVRITKTRHTGGALSPCDENDSTVHESVATNLRDRETSLLICCNSTNDCTVKVAH